MTCHKEFTGLDELIVFTGSDIEGAFGALGERLPQSTAMIKHKVAKLVQEDFEVLARMIPNGRNLLSESTRIGTTLKDLASDRN